MKAAKINKTRIELVVGDITEETVDAIVNAANESLRGGGGVDGAIHQAAGAQLYQECVTIGRCPTGEARITGGYNLPAKHIIHTVGPVYHRHDHPAKLLADAHYNSLQLAHLNRFKSVSFPAISTGAYGYPVAEAATIALETVVDFINKNQPKLELVRFVLFQQATYDAFATALEDIIATVDAVERA